MAGPYCASFTLHAYLEKKKLRKSIFVPLRPRAILRTYAYRILGILFPARMVAYFLAADSGDFLEKKRRPTLSHTYRYVLVGEGIASRTTEYAPLIHTNTHQIQWALFLNCTARPILGRFLVLVSCATYQSGKRSHCPTHIGERFAATTAALRIAPLQLALRC